MIPSARASIVSEILARRASAIIRTADGALAERAMAAALAGGFRLAEFTLTTPDALDLIARCAADRSIVVGAGTVLSVGAARDAVSAGARFLVSPVCDPAVIAAAHDLDVPCIPGTFTPTEMQTAYAAGADFVKLFPAPANVADTIRAIRGPLPHLRIYPTAGVDLENCVEVLAAGAAGVGFVRSLFVPDDLERRDFAAIEARARRIVARIGGATTPAAV